MSTQAEKEAIVARAVASFAKVEQALEEIHTGFQELEQIYRDGADAGMTNTTEVARTIQAFRKLSGKSADIGGTVYDLHARGTEIAKDNNADSALPPGYVVPFGGGGR